MATRQLRVLIFLFILASVPLFLIRPALCAKPTSPQPSRPTSALPAVDDALKGDLQRLTNRVLQLEMDLAKASKPTQTINLATAVIAGGATLVAALLAGGLTLLGQNFTAKREDRRTVLTAERALELARSEAIYQHTEKILEYRLKQMELFYAPMFALLEQSRALYEKMYRQLAEDEPASYKLLSEADAEGYRVYVRAKDDTWKGFRLLDQLPAVKRNARALPLVDRILQIGEQMTKIISEHAGLASKDLIDLLGEYLAHYAILSTIYKGTETVPYEPGWHKMLYYPRRLNQMIEDGYRELSEFLDGYAKASKRMLESLPGEPPSQQD